MEGGNPFEDERVKLVSFYPSEWKPNTLVLQRRLLLEAFPGLNLPDPAFAGSSPSGFEIPAYNVFPERLGRRYGIRDGNGDNYGRVLERLILPTVALVYNDSAYGFLNDCSGRLGPDDICLEPRGRVILEALQEATDYDAFIAPVSYGYRWYPWCLSPSNARETALLKNELTAGSIQVGCHLIAQPLRLTHCRHLRLACPGDIYNPKGPINARGTTSFSFPGGDVPPHLEFHGVGHSPGRYGSVG